jgi:hypothetical protein
MFEARAEHHCKQTVYIFQIIITLPPGTHNVSGVTTKKIVIEILVEIDGNLNHYYTRRKCQ